MKNLLVRIKRAWLRMRIDQAQSDLLLASERHGEYAQAMIGIEEWMREQQVKLRGLRARFALLERPEKLLEEALKGGSR